MTGSRMSPSAGDRTVIVRNVVRQHAEDAASLHAARTILTRTGHAGLPVLADVDERLAAHLDGLSIAREQALPFCQAALEAPSAGAVFAATIQAIDDKVEPNLRALLALSEAEIDARPGMISAFGWVEREQLKGVVAGLLRSQDPFSRAVGIRACAVHRVDPGLLSARGILDPGPLVRAPSLRTAGEIGCQEALQACTAALRDPDQACAFWAAWSSVLLGNRGAALDVVASAGLTSGVHQTRAFRLALQAMSTRAGHELLRQLAKDAAQLRWLIQGSGIAGDGVYGPWLIKHMANEKTARVAGESFSLITGLDLGQSGLAGSQPEGFESGPNDDPDDPNVDMDPDDGLPWPDVQKIESWWASNSSRFQNGTRYFMGAPVTREHCIAVLKNGYQKQRILAAHYLCLLEPGTTLFNTSAPAWRQERLLASLG